MTTSPLSNKPDLQNTIGVTYFFRKPFDFHFSIENIFKEIIKNLSENIQYKIFELPFYSKGIIARFKNMMVAKKNQGQVNHITGDIHFIALGLKKSHTILTIHDLGFMKHENPILRFLLWFFWIWLPVKKVRYVTTISESTKKDIVKYSGCNPDKIKVIPNFTNPCIRQVTRPFNKQQPVILQIGTQFNKNLERTIKSLENIPCTLKIIGKLSKHHKNLLQSHHLDYINKYNLTENDLFREYIECDMLVFCSTLEGFGLPILEAQATGIPVVTSNISSMPEVAGDAACLVDPFSIKSIRQGILKIIHNDEYRQSLIKGGLENVKRFDITKITREYIELYKDIAIS